MTSRFLFLTSFLFLFLVVPGQNSARQDADSMIKELTKLNDGAGRIRLLLELAQFHIFKPGELAKDFDSAMFYIREANSLNKSVKSSVAYGYQLLTESYLTKEKGQQDAAKKMVEKAITILESTNDKSYLGKAYYELSSHYDHKEPEQLSRKILLVEKAIHAFHVAGNREKEAFSLHMLADLYSIAGDDQKSMELIKSSLAIYESINYKQLQSVYALLGSMYKIRDDYGQALQYELKALKTAETLGDTTMQLCQINTILGGIYRELDRHELSVKYFRDALKIAQKNDDRYSVALLVLNVVTVYDKINRPQETVEFLESLPRKYVSPDNDLEKSYIAMAFCRAYTTASMLDKAKSFSLMLLKLAESNTLLGDTKNNINRLLATYFFATKEYTQARIFLTRNKILSSQFAGSLRYALDCRLWFKLDSAMGNYQSALTNLIAYRTVTDSLFNVTKSRQLQQIEVEYETSKKEDSLKLKDQNIIVLTQENNLQQAHLQQAGLIKNVTIAGIIVAFIVIGLLYRQYRHKQHSNNIVTQKNEQLQHLLTEKEWLLKEIHHRVKNNLQIVMSLLNSQSAYIDNEPALTAIHDSQHRVHAMSLIHQKLYNTENVSSIGMSVYIRELASYLIDSFDTGQRIRFVYDIEPIKMDVSQAVPLGLILNEAITNAIKYAFPDGRRGVISISLSSTALHHYLLIVSDDGIGMPAHLHTKNGSLGMSLMQGLSEDLNGNFWIEKDKGTSINISFVHDENVKRSETVPTSFVSSN